MKLSPDLDLRLTFNLTRRTTFFAEDQHIRFSLNADIDEKMTILGGGSQDQRHESSFKPEESEIDIKGGKEGEKHM